MKKVIGKRDSGKTHLLIELSHSTGDYIVCHSKEEALRLQRETKKLGFDIALPITYREFLNKEYRGGNISGFLIDNADMFLQSLTDVPINAITMNI